MTIQFKVKKHVTVPVLKIPDNGAPIYVRVNEAIHTAKDNTGRMPATPKEGEVKRKPPQLMQVTNLETGEIAQIVAGTVLESELKENYPGDGYVGKCFEIKKFKASGTKAYALYQVAEIEVEEESAATKPAKK